MRLFRRSISTVVFLSPALVLMACGSSVKTGEGATPDAGGITTDGSVAMDGAAHDGAAPSDGSAPTTDGAASTTDGSARTDGGGSGPKDAGPVGDTGILGDNCPALDAASYAVATHGPLPTMIYSDGGILANPKVVTMTFTDTFNPTELNAFGDSITLTSWFAQVTRDYCTYDGGTCITGAAGSSVAMPVAGGSNTYIDNNFNGPDAGLSDAGVDLTGFIVGQIAVAIEAGVLTAPDPNAIYSIYFPTTATVYMGDPNLGGSAGCQVFGAYHSAVPYRADGGGPMITYSVVPDCAQTGEPAKDELDNMTVASSHEIVEATTDPYNGSGWYLEQYPYYTLDGGAPTTAELRNQPWANAVTYGEVADNCESLDNATWTLDGGGLVQRIWSTSAAAKGDNPCIPVPATETYYAASPDKVMYVVDAGGSFTVDITSFAPAARESWRLDARDWTSSQSTQYLSFEFVGGADAGPGLADYICANNDSAVQLKVTLLADPAADSSLTQRELWPEADGVIVSADVDNWYLVPTADGGTEKVFPDHPWPFAVVTPAIAATIGVTTSGVVDARRVNAMPAGARKPTRNWQPVRGTRPHAR